MNNDDYIRAWEQRVGPAAAHLNFDEFHPKKIMNAEFKKGTFGFNFNNKIITDFGCGGGLFAAWIYKKYNVKKYIGFDIADRSLSFATDKLRDKENYELIKIDTTISKETGFQKAIKMNSDCFICFSVIQHFPDEKYFNNFMNCINNYDNTNLFIQIRAGKTMFREEPYKTTHDIALACIIDPDLLIQKLSNYELINQTEKAKNGYQYFHFTKRV